MTDAETVFARFRGHEEDPDVQDRLWSELAATTLADPDVPFHEHWRLYETVFADRHAEDGPPVAWRPPLDESSNIEDAMDNLGMEEYADFHQWSVRRRDDFWAMAMRRIGVPFAEEPERILDDSAGAEDCRWLPRARMNAAEMCWQAPQEKAAIRWVAQAGAAPVDITYGELRAQADACSQFLAARGLQEGDAVALYMPMTPDCVAWYLGIVQAGMAVVSIPDSFAAREIETRLRLGDAKLIITNRTMVRGGKPIPLGQKAAEAAKDVGIDAYGAREGESMPAPGGSFRIVAGDPEAASNILFSSGTTGEPKAIPWTHLTPIKAAVDGHFHQDIHGTDVVAWPTNIGWMMGPWLIYATFANQATMALYGDAPTGQAFVDAMDACNTTVLGVVPAIVRSWRTQGLGPGSLPRVRLWSSTGEASNAHDYLYLMSLARYRAPVIEYCGGTEIGGAHITGTVVQQGSPATFTSPALGLDFVVLDEEGAPVAPGDHGQIFLVPPSIGLSQRLLNRDHHEEYYAGCPRGPDGEALRRHGDELHVLHKGFWSAGGRADDTMNLGGIKVSSIELETAMNTAEAVQETAAVGIKPKGGGADRLVVFAVAPGAEVDEVQQVLQNKIKMQLNPLFRIHEVLLVDHLPRTASNKVMRRELRQQYSEA